MNIEQKKIKIETRIKLNYNIYHTSKCFLWVVCSVFSNVGSQHAIYLWAKQQLPLEYLAIYLGTNQLILGGLASQIRGI